MLSLRSSSTAASSWNDVIVIRVSSDLRDDNFLFTPDVQLHYITQPKIFFMRELNLCPPSQHTLRNVLY